jgi:hypothetical protein
LFLGKIFGENTRIWTQERKSNKRIEKLHNESYNLYCSQNTVGLIQPNGKDAMDGTFNTSRGDENGRRNFNRKELKEIDDFGNLCISNRKY